MNEFVVLFGLLLLIFISSTRVEYYTVASLMRLTGSRNLSFRLFSILFLPGTIVHEFCHLFMAQLLGVRSSSMVLFPRIESDHVVMGEVGIESTDMVRRLLIGAAPFLLGFPLTLLFIFTLISGNLNWWQIGILLYLIFQIANASFSSAKDMEGSFVVVSIVALGLLVLYLAGLPVYEWFFDLLAPLTLNGRIESINKLLCLPLGINVGIWLFGKWILG